MQTPYGYPVSPRMPLATIDRLLVSEQPGVYVVHRGEHPVFVGRAASLRAAISHALNASAAPPPPLRLTAAEILGIARAASIRGGRYRLTPEDLARIVAWMRSCTVEWMECATESEAVRLETLVREGIGR